MRKDSNDKTARCSPKTVGVIKYSLCPDSPDRFTSHPIFGFEAVMHQVSHGASRHHELDIGVFVRGKRGVVNRYGNQAVMSHKQSEELKTFFCVLHDSGQKFPVSVLPDLPYKARLTCRIPSDFEGSSAPNISLRGVIGGDAVDLRIPLCEREQRPKGRVAICSAPLFLGPGLPPNRIIEWIEYYRILGVEHFHIYDRDDALKDVLARHVKEGVVTRHKWLLFEDAARDQSDYYDQHFAQDACIMRHRDQHDWFLFVDPDEYLHVSPPGEGALKLYLDDLEEGDHAIAQVMIQNLLIAGPLQPGKALLVEQYIHRASVTVPWRQKPLIHGASVEFLWAHFAARLRCGHTVMAHPNVVRANHYMVADGRKLKDAPPEVEDLSALWVAPKLASNIAKTKRLSI